MSDELHELQRRLAKLRQEAFIATQELERYEGLVNHYQDVCKMNQFEIVRLENKIKLLEKGDQGEN